MSERESASSPSASSAAGDDQSQANETRASARSERSGGQPPHRRRHQQNQPRREASQTKATINMDELREVIELVSQRGFTDFEFENADIRLRLRREIATSSPAQASSATSTSHTSAPGATQSTSALTNAPAQSSIEAGAKQEDELETIASPIVGTFYRSPSPTSEPFVRAGEHVEPDSVVCIIEAMKLMNEIQAETSGVIEKIYVENGQPVEFGQPLFGVRKS